VCPPDKGRYLTGQSFRFPLVGRGQTQCAGLAKTAQGVTESDHPGVAIRDAPAPSSSTIPADTSESTTERVLHIAAFTFVGAVLLLAATSLLGVRTGTVSAQSEGYSIEVLRTQVSRPGLATPFGVVISTIDGTDLPATITLRLDTSYLASFDFNGLEPTPSASFSNERWTWWSFDVPSDQSSLRIGLDARLEPSVQWARSGSATLEIDGSSLVGVDFTTWVMP
jgi:hypothetical protein